MPTAPASRSFAPSKPFKFIGGDPSLDFVDTADWTPQGPLEDRLTDYDRLLDWAEKSGVLGKAQVSRLRARAARSPRAAKEALEASRHCRWVLHRVFESVVSGKRALDAIGDFNALLREAHEHLALTPRAAGSSATARAGAPLRWEWRDAGEHLDAVRWPIVRAAAALLVSDEAAHVRVCGGPDCGWMYVDRSRNGLRRWCEMSVCGTREKSRRRAMKLTR